MTLKFARWLRKWVWCSWRHYYHRCYPTVWGPEQAAEIDQPYTPNYWHCARCHPCNEWVQQVIKEYEDESCQPLVHVLTAASTHVRARCRWTGLP